MPACDVKETVIVTVYCWTRVKFCVHRARVARDAREGDARNEDWKPVWEQLQHVLFEGLSRTTWVTCFVLPSCLTFLFPAAGFSRTQ